MADYNATPNYAFKMPTDHANTNTWGGYNNGNWSSVDGLIGSIKGQLSQSNLTLIGTSTAAATVQFDSPGGARWIIGEDGTAETGGNAGSNFIINRYSDAGSYIDTPVEIDRSNGGVHFADAAYVVGTLGVGGTLGVAGTITGYGLIDPSGYLVSRAAVSNNANFVLENSAGTPAGYLLWDYTTNAVSLMNNTGGAALSLNASGSATFNGAFACSGSLTGSGMLSKPGVSGTADAGHQYNFYWTGTQNHLYLDNSDWGQIQTTSDYRVKKDIEPLGSMWGAVKALNPISYTHKDWTPPSGSPSVIGDNVEHWGFLAHELQETLVESAANGVKDDPVHVQSPNPFTVIAALTKALQEAMARIEALEAAG